MIQIEADKRRRWRGFPSLASALLASGLAAALSANGAEAATMRVPSCEALATWGANLSPHDTTLVAPRVALPQAFAEPGFSHLFDLPALAWTTPDIQAAKQAIGACYRQARKRRDGNAAHALVSANRAITGELAKTVGTLHRAKDTAVAAERAIESLPDSPELSRGIGVLFEANPAAPDMNGLRALPHDVAEPINRLARTLPSLAPAEREPIFKALTARRDRMEAAAAASSAKEIAAAPASAAGILALLEQRQNVARLAITSTRTQLDQQITARINEIRNGLRAAKPPVWVPPACIALYSWAAEPGATVGTPVGRKTIQSMASDPRAVPVFGLSLADWTDEDLALLGKLQNHCRTEVHILQRQKAPGGPTAEQTALLAAAAKAGWITDKSRIPVFAAARTTLMEQRKAVAELQAAEVKIAALPDDTQALATLNAMRTQPGLDVVGKKDFDHFRDVFDAKLNAIGAHAAAAAIKGLSGVKVAKLADLVALQNYTNKVAPAIPVQSGRQQYAAAYERTLSEAATRLLPQFQAKLNAMPASPEGIGEAKTAVAKLTGINDLGRLTGLAPLHAAAEKRIDTMVATMRGKACDALLGSLGARGEAKRLVWDGKDGGIPFGKWTCGLAAQGVQVSGWSGPGFFSSTATMKVTMPHGSLQTFSLHNAEVQPGKTMLVGFAMKDANQETKLSADQWAGLAAAAETGVMMDTDGCKRFANIEPEKIAAADKPYWLQCGLTMSGLAKRGLK